MRPYVAMRMYYNQNRLDIYNYVSSQGPKTATQIYIALGMTQSYCSQILAEFRYLGLFNTERKGRNVYYSLNEEMDAWIDQWIEDYPYNETANG